VALFSFVVAALALGGAFRRYCLGLFVVYLTLAFRMFRIFILGGKCGNGNEYDGMAVKE
jgi:hypothetical protein